MSAAEQIDHLCEVMHDAYEKAAAGAGWETQEASRKPWADVPEANKTTMRAAVAALLEEVGRQAFLLSPASDPQAHTAVGLYADLLDADGQYDRSGQVRKQLAKVDAPTAPMQLNRSRVDAALRSVIEDLDYDLHKGLEEDEETGADTYDEWVTKFQNAYNKQL